MLSLLLWFLAILCCYELDSVIDTLAYEHKMAENNNKNDNITPNVYETFIW